MCGKIRDVLTGIEGLRNLGIEELGDYELQEI